MNQLKTTLLDSFRYREVLYNMLSRDLKLKYKRTLFGYFWSLLNPMLQLAVLTLVFSHLVRLGGMKNYTLYLFSGSLAWTFFQGSLLITSSVLLDYEPFIKKIYLPKLIFPLSRTCMALIDFLLALVALTLLALLLGFSVKVSVLLVPIPIVFLFLFTLGTGIFFSVLTVYFRDIQYLLSVFLQLMYFATPIIYPLSSLPESYHKFVWINPVYSQIYLFQQLIYAGEIPSIQAWLAAGTVAIMALVVGLMTLILCEEDLVFRM